MGFFDSFVDLPPTGTGWWLMERLNRHHLDKLRELAPDTKRVAEIGPSVGAFARICRDASIRYVAVEPNPGMCASMQSEGHDVVAGWVPPLPFANGRLDAVHASHVIEHNPTFREAMDFVAECRRVVKVGGLVSLSGPDFDHLGNEFFKTHYSHSLPINMRRLLQLLADGGLEIRHAAYLSGPFHGRLRLLTQTLAWLSTARLIWLLTLGRMHLKQCYSAKMTFMRAVWVVAERTS